MTAPVVTSAVPVTLAGGAGLPPGLLEWALARAPRLVAADGAGGAVLAAGHLPEAVIGDLDSLDPVDARRLPRGRVHRVDEQDSTDFEKCLARIAAPLVIGVGFIGGRLDHTLAALSSLARSPVRCLLAGACDVAFHASGPLALDLAVGSRLSVFPMRPVRGVSRGLEWPLDGLALDPAGRIGTSNRVTGPVTLEFEGPGAVVILPLAARDAALAAFGWPAARGR